MPLFTKREIIKGAAKVTATAAAMLGVLLVVDARDRHTNENTNPNYDKKTDTFKKVEVECPSTDTATLARQTLKKTFTNVHVNRRPQDDATRAVITEPASGRKYNVSTDCKVTWKF